MTYQPANEGTLRLIRQKLGWGPSRPLKAGLSASYDWINRQLQMPAAASLR